MKKGTSRECNIWRSIELPHKDEKWKFLGPSGITRDLLKRAAGEPVLEVKQNENIMKKEEEQGNGKKFKQLFSLEKVMHWSVEIREIKG